MTVARHGVAVQQRSAGAVCAWRIDEDGADGTAEVCPEKDAAQQQQGGRGAQRKGEGQKNGDAQIGTHARNGTEENADKDADVDKDEVFNRQKMTQSIHNDIHAFSSFRQGSRTCSSSLKTKYSTRTSATTMT